MEHLQVEPLLFHGLPTPDGSQSSDLVDSPLEDGSTSSRLNGMLYEARHSPPAKKPSNKSSGSKKPKSADNKANSAFRFVVVDHPNQLRDRQEMRENRMHVMHDYLNKERRRPESRDTRVNGSARSNRRPKNLGVSTMPTKTATNLDLPTNNFRVDVSRLTPTDSFGSDSSSDRETVEKSSKRPAPVSRSKNGVSNEPAALIRRVYNPPSDDKRLVSGIGGRWEYSSYMRATPNDIPVGPGASLNPFGILPMFVDPSLDVNSLKWSCSQRFGSDKLAIHWIPALLRARHAFLSTLCISSSHDAIMSRALVPTHVQSSYRNIQRWRVKNEVIALLGECMRDPELQTADETIVAVVHLLVSDIMGCDDRDLKVHIDGLQQMATARGGLEKLGVGGELAAIMTIMNYLIAALREIQPHTDYVKFALKLTEQSARATNEPEPLPESPVYCPPNGFHTILRVAPQGSDIHELLDTVRALTNAFYIERSIPGPTGPTRFWEDPHETVSSLCRKVFAFQPARDKEFNDMNERYTYESIRLTSLVYAHALANGIPISKAAEELGRRDPSSPSRKVSDPGSFDKPPSIAVQIKYALVRTDFSFCWDHMGGVLFWVALVAGAAANPGPFANEERSGEEEDARKFLAAIGVRCCVVLSFQYGPAIVETLKRLVMIETALVKPETPTCTPENIWAMPAPQTSVGKAFGPLEPSEMQKGFADFVQDFLSS